MIFTVIFEQKAEDELIEIWLAASDQKEISDASNTLDRLLRVDAHRLGQPFFGERLVVVVPLAALYTVSLDDRLVKVLQIQRIS